MIGDDTTMKLQLLLAGLLASLLIGCGSDGGSDDDFSGAARLQLDITPKDVDTGDRISGTVEIRDIYEGGIILKIQYPAALSYVASTSYVRYNGGSRVDLSPTTEATSSSGDLTYLVYTLTDEMLNDRSDASVTFELQANDQTDEDSDSVIAVDADVDSGGAFDVENPGFTSQDEQVITVTAE